MFALDRQARFDAVMSPLLGAAEVILLSANVAKGPLWVVTMRLPSQALFSIHVDLRPDQDLYSDETARDVASHILTYLRNHGYFPA